MLASKLIKEIDEVLTGIPWYGSQVVKIIEQVDQKWIHEKKGGPHSIADILLHMIAWTEETNERLKGKVASDPARGDWPDPSEHSWVELIGLFMLSNDHLKNTIVKMDDKLLSEQVNDNRKVNFVESENYIGLIRGIIQHNIYHSAQIALLNKQTL